jgi:uncharacterized membrane protein YgdD (TMEM256/DUF423 family)
MNNTIIRTGVLFGILAVVFGAFGAHVLKDALSAEALQSFDTGVKYQMYHALLLVLLSTIKTISEKQKRIVFILLVFGILFFSFSIYLLATADFTGIDFKSFGLLTPLGGMLFILGWLFIGIYGTRKQV